MLFFVGVLVEVAKCPGSSVGSGSEKEVVGTCTTGKPDASDKDWDRDDDVVVDVMVACVVSYVVLGLIRYEFAIGRKAAGADFCDVTKIN